MRRRLLITASLVAAVRGAISVRPVASGELLRYARFRAAAFSENARTASAERTMAVHRLVEERVSRGATMLAAVADGDDAAAAADADGGGADAESDGWHPGLDAPPDPLRALADGARALFARPPETTLDQALGDGAIVGVADFSEHEFSLPTHSLAPNYGLYATALAVHPAYRRAGVASALLAEGTSLARRRDLSRLVLHVEEENEGAIDFYEAAGFSQQRVDGQLAQFATALGLDANRHRLYARGLD